MIRLTMSQAIALCDSLDVAPETQGFGPDGSGEIQFNLPRFSPDDALAYIEVVTGGLQIDPNTILIGSDTVEGSEMAFATVTIKTEG